MTSCRQVSVIERSHTINNHDTIIYKEKRDRYSVNDTTYIRDSVIVMKIINHKDSLIMRDTIYAEADKAVNKFRPFNDLFLLICGIMLLLLIIKLT